MATVIDFQNGHIGNWTEQELSNCEYLNGGYRTEMPNCTAPKYNGWVNGAASSECDNAVMVGDCHTDISNSLEQQAKQLRQCWKIRQFLNAIQQSWHKQGQITAEALKNFPLILFSPVLDQAQPRKDSLNDSGYFTDPNLATPRTSSETELFSLISENRQNGFLPVHFGLLRLSKTARRHCNSESDLTWSTPNHVTPTLDSKGPYLPSNGSSHLEDTSPESVAFPASSEDRRTAAVESECSSIEEEVASGETHEVNHATHHTLEAQAEQITQFSLGLESHINLSQSSDSTESTLTVTSLDNNQTNSECCTEEETNSRVPPKTESTAKIAKTVSFADEVGQPLTEVFVIESADQQKAFEYEAGDDGSMWTSNSTRSRITESIFSRRFTRSRLKHRTSLLMNAPNLPVASSPNLSMPFGSIAEKTRFLWVLCFPQPASQYYKFRQRIDHGAVSLESITLTQPDETSTAQLPQLSGTIKVKNISYEKQVWIRLTTDNWRSFNDFVALYSPQLSGGMLHSYTRSDTFTFHLNVVPQMETDVVCDKVEFAVRYLVGPDGSWGQYWDNNGGENYTIERRAVQSSWPNQLSECHTSTETTIAAERRGDAPGCDLTAIGDTHSNTSSYFHPYTHDYRPNFEGITQFTNYRAWMHFAGETTYY